MNTLHRIKLHTIIIIATAAALLTGCQSPTFHSTEYKLSSPATNAASEGFAYFLPKGYVHLVADLQSGGGSASYKTTVDVSLQPDPNHLFLLQPQISAWAHDSYGISVQNGLLTNVGTTNVDQTGGVFLKVAELAGLVATMAGVTQTTNADTNLSALPTHLDMTLDPDTFAEEQGQLIQSAHLVLKITPNFTAAKNPALPVDANGKDNTGIFYRPLLPYTVSVTDNNNHGAQYRTVVLLPNGSPILALVPRRATMVTTKTSIVFDHGCPTSLSLDRDSPALAWFSLPLDMIKAFLSAPAELVQLKLNFASTNAQLGAQELTELKNQLSILQQQAALQQYILTNAPAKPHP